jgi:hypothetical protein
VVGWLGVAGQNLSGRLSAKRGLDWKLNGDQRTPLRENHTAEETANGIVGRPKQ